MEWHFNLHLIIIDMGETLNFMFTLDNMDNK
jgi:hypothetical protein